MRHIFIRLITAGTLVLAGHSFAVDERPYEAVVLDQGAEVRAGPGRRFYVTQELEPGARLEVYHREAGDWLAIRPPEGSFSWIPSADLEMTQEPEIAEVAAEETKSWIGSRAERIREHKSHLALPRGERVEVLGKKQVEGEDGKAQLWLKIAPPAGEFRWVHSSQVRRARADELAAALKEEMLPVHRIARAADPAESQSSRSTLAEARTSQPQSATPWRSSVVLSDLASHEEALEEETDGSRFPVRNAAHEEPVAAVSRGSLSPDGFVPRRRQPAPPSVGAENSPRLATVLAKENQPAQRAPNTTGVPVASRGGDDLSRELDDLDLQLSLMLSRDKSGWNLGGIKKRVTQLVEEGATPGERGQARFMLEKIQQFEDAFDIHSLPQEPPASPAPSKDFRPYDGEGWLTSVKSADKPVAPYALVDQDGKRICFVSPAPGLSVSRHLNKHVGLYAKRGLIPDLNVPHLLVSKVVDLERQIR